MLKATIPPQLVGEAIVAGVGKVADPGSHQSISPDRCCAFSANHRGLGFEILISDFKSSPSEGGISDLKGRRKQKQRANRDKKNGNAWIVFEMPYTGKQEADR